MEHRPESFEASIGGAFGPSYRVELQPDGALCYEFHAEGYPPAPGTISQRVAVADERWRRFRQALDRANVWAWEERYEFPGICDGTSWALRISYGDASVCCSGSNDLPPDREFAMFRRAVVRLLGGLRFE